MPILEVKNLNMSYGGKTVLENLSFTIEKGAYLCVVGDNGMGKSTLVKGLLGLSAIQGGTIKFANGTDRTKIGYLPQQKETQSNFPCLVKEVILSGFLNKKGIIPFYNAKDKKIATDVAKDFGIAELLQTPYAHLSGGQKQRVLLSRAVCSAENMLFLDEPTTSLDAQSCEMLYKKLAELNSNGMTVVMVTHDADAMKNADCVLHIGKECFFGTKDEYLKYTENGGEVLC